MTDYCLIPPLHILAIVTNFTSWIDRCVTSAMAHRLLINIEAQLEYICSDHHPLLVKISYSPSVNHHNNICDEKSFDYKRSTRKI